MSKKTIMTISQYNYDKLQELEGATMDDKVKNLLSIVSSFMPNIPYTEKNKPIKAELSTKESVDAYRITIGESRDNILTRAFLILDELNNSDVEEEWIPFKLTNPYNNLLVIDGQIEYSSRELSFNYRGNLYRNKLPSNYIVDGKDLTKELYLWYDNLDWQKIEKQIIDNVDIPFSTIEKDYILEVNVILKKE